jgi:hypothetical protein
LHFLALFWRLKSANISYHVVVIFRGCWSSVTSVNILCNLRRCQLYVITCATRSCLQWWARILHGCRGCGVVAVAFLSISRLVGMWSVTLTNCWARTDCSGAPIMSAFSLSHANLRSQGYVWRQGAGPVSAVIAHKQLPFLWRLPVSKNGLKDAESRIPQQSPGSCYLSSTV